MDIQEKCAKFKEFIQEIEVEFDSLLRSKPENQADVISLRRQIETILDLLKILQATRRNLMQHDNTNVSINTNDFTNPNYVKLGQSLGALITKKQKAYGNSFEKSGEVLKILFPNGMAPEQYQDVLTIARVIDKLFRIANQKDAFSENPWQDIAGYALLSVATQKGGL